MGEKERKEGERKRERELISESMLSLKMVFSTVHIIIHTLYA